MLVFKQANTINIIIKMNNIILDNNRMYGLNKYSLKTKLPMINTNGINIGFFTSLILLTALDKIGKKITILNIKIKNVDLFNIPLTSTNEIS